MVASSTNLRPIRSPRMPKMIPPSGRTAKPTKKVPKLAIRATPGSWEGKNSGPKIRAEARLKSEVVVFEGAPEGARPGGPAQVGRGDGRGHRVVRRRGEGRG